MKSPYDPIEEGDRDQPARRAEWMQRGRIAPPGQSAAALRVRAHQQKMAMRAQREAAGAEVTQPQGALAVSGWVGLGPAPLVSDSNFFGMVSGRATSVAIDPSDTTGNTVYVGGAYGGVWKSTNAADSVLSNVTWTPVTDQQASLATGAVSVKPDGTVVLVGTGEPNNAIDSYYGVGILRSTDGGATWTLIPSADSGTHPFAGLGTAKFAWSTANPNTVVAAMATSAVGFENGAINNNTNRGLYLSTNAGQTWAYQALTDGSTPISATDVVYDATAGKFFASIRSHGIYSSTNGTNWTRLTNQPNPTALTLTNCPTNALSSCPLYRGQLAVVPGRDEVYVWFVDINDNDGGIWRSINGGAWTSINETGIAACGDSFGCGTQQAFYNLEIYGVPDGTATDLYAGAVNLFKCKLASGATSCSTLDSTQGAKWINLTHVYNCPSIASVHPDEHGLDFAVIGGKSVMYFANDGGVYRALDGFTGLLSGTCGKANAFDDLNGPIGSMTQFVSFSLHPTDQKTVLGGTQDNGSPATSSATSSQQWITVNGGDGGFNAINPTTPTQWFSANTDVSIQVCNSGINCNTNTFLPIVTNGTVGGDAGPFYTPYILDPQNVGELVVGTCRIWRGTTGGVGFTSLSPNFDTGVSGVGGTCTGGEVNQVRSIDAGGPKASNLSSVIYATTDGTGPNVGGANQFGGEIWVTTSAGTTQMTNRTGTINPANYTISSVAVDTSVANGQTAYVGIMGFGVSHVFKTTTAGASWTDWSGTGLPDAPVNALLVDAANHLVYAGTDVGVFVSSTTSAVWTEVGPLAQPGATGYLPNVPVSAIRMFNSGGVQKLRVSTYGRGIWEFPIAATPDFTNVISDSPQSVFPTQNATFHGTIAVQNGYNSAINLSCTGTTPTTCTLNPTQEPAPGSGTYTVTAGGVVGDYNFNAHAVGTDSSTTTHDAPITLHVVDFAVGTPGPISVHDGLTATGSFQVTASGSFAQAVTLSCSSGLPSGAACSFAPNPASPTSTNAATVTLTVTAAANTPPGTTTVTIQGTTTSPAATRTATFSLTVLSAPDFTWSGSGSHTVLAGQTTPSYSFIAAPTNGDSTFVADVTFNCTGLPDSTAACVFSPLKIAAGTPAAQGQVTMTITTKGPNPGTGTRAQLSRVSDGRSGSPFLPLTLPIAGVILVIANSRRLPSRRSTAGLLISLAAGAMLLSCGGGGSTPPPPPPVSVTIVPSTAVNLYANETGNVWPANLTQQQYTATVQHSTNQNVTWSLSQSGTDCTTNPACGSLSATTGSPVTYTAPATVPNPPNVSVRAVAQADTTKSASDAVSILTPTTLGTFNVTVTATEGSKAHSQTVSLTVQ